MKVSNGVYKKVTIDWANVTLPLKEGSPVSSAGVVANSGSAFGIVPQAYKEEPLEKSIYVLVGGHVDLNEIETLYGSSYDDAAISALNGIHFYKNGKSIDYTLPKASADTLGGIKVGSGLSIDSSGVLSASGGGTFVVHSEYDDVTSALTLDKTWEEIHDALVDGKIPILAFDSDGEYTSIGYIYATMMNSLESYAVYGFMIDTGSLVNLVFETNSEDGYPSITEDNGGGGNDGDEA